jgi:hypothetical protein
VPGKGDLHSVSPVVQRIRVVIEKRHHRLRRYVNTLISSLREIPDFGVVNIMQSRNALRNDNGIFAGRLVNNDYLIPWIEYPR